MLTILVAPNKAFKFCISGCPPDQQGVVVYGYLWGQALTPSRLHLTHRSLCFYCFCLFVCLFLIFHSFCPFNYSIWKFKSHICMCWSLSHVWLWSFSCVRFFGTPGSSILEVLQARILGWVAIPFSRGSSQPRDWTQVSCIEGRFFTIWATREALAFKSLAVS